MPLPRMTKLGHGVEVRTHYPISIFYKHSVCESQENAIVRAALSFFYLGARAGETTVIKK